MMKKCLSSHVRQYKAHAGFIYRCTRESLCQQFNVTPYGDQAIRDAHCLQEEHFACDEQGNGFADFSNKGQLEEAADALLCMDTAPPEHMVWSLLKAINKSKALGPAKQVYNYLSCHPLQFTPFLSDYLVSTLAKCGGLKEALDMFQTLEQRTVFSWTSIIAAYTEQMEGQQALEMYQLMLKEGVNPNEYTFVNLLKACGSILDLEHGKAIDADIQKRGFDSFIFVGTALLTMYAKCGSTADAEKIFHTLSERSVVAWNAMFAAYVEQGKAETCLELYQEMQKKGVIPNERTYVSLLQACCLLADEEDSSFVEGQSIKPGSLKMGEVLHEDVKDRGLDSNIFIGNGLIKMYSKCGNVDQALDLFVGLSERNVVSWTMLLSALVERGQAKVALQLYRQMFEDSVQPNEWTLAMVLQACCKIAEEEEVLVSQGESSIATSFRIGQALHADARKKGFDSHVYVGSTLLNLYGKCHSIAPAESVFVRLLDCDVVAWNAMLSVYLENNSERKLLQLYKQMHEEGVCPNARSIMMALQACSVLADKEATIIAEGRPIKAVSLQIGQALHADAQMHCFDNDRFVGSSIVCMYGKTGSIVEAENVFHRLSLRDVVAWTSMLSAYVEQGLVQKALQLYRQMYEEDVTLDEAMLVCIVQVCSEIGSAKLCSLIHTDIVSTGRENSLLLATALIHAYGSCTCMLDAKSVFVSVPQRDVVSWSALISGYSQEGDFQATIQNFDKMLSAGVRPNGVTFLALLSACSHACLVDKGVDYFVSMGRDFGITPGIEHYVTIVDLLGNAGDFVRVTEILSQMPMEPDLAMWLCLLGACRKHGNLELGSLAFDHAVQLQPSKASAYVLMSNIYANSGMSDCAAELDSYRQKGHAQKKPGECWIEHRNVVHSFVVGDLDHPQHKPLTDLLQQMRVKLKDGGHIPQMEFVFRRCAEAAVIC